MKKIITVLAIALFTFVACEKEEIEKAEPNNPSITVTSFHCGHCGSRNIKVFYTPSSQSHLPPSYTCNDCGKGGVLKPIKK